MVDPEPLYSSLRGGFLGDLLATKGHGYAGIHDRDGLTLSAQGPTRMDQVRLKGGRPEYDVEGDSFPSIIAMGIATPKHALDWRAWTAVYRSTTCRMERCCVRRGRCPPSSESSIHVGLCPEAVKLRRWGLAGILSKIDYASSSGARFPGRNAMREKRAHHRQRISVASPTRAWEL